MGVMRFRVRPRELLDDWPEVFRAYISGMDGRVYPTRIEVNDDLVTCRRQVSESGRLNVAWPVEGFGRPVVTTSSLAERDEPYILPVELARGKIAQVRDQASAWEISGMVIPEDFCAVNREAHQAFRLAVALQEDPQEAGRLADQALAKAYESANVLARAYTEQRLNVRRRRSKHLPASLGCHLGQSVFKEEPTQKFGETFNAAGVPVEWRHVEPVEGEYHWETSDAQVEWCLQNKLLMYGGPLLDLSPNGLPAWLWQWEHDVLNLQSFVCDFVETAISRYVGKIRNWEISARVNTGGVMTLNEEQRLGLVARTLEVARQVDDEIQLLIRIDQPWGDYQARGQHRLSPLQFVDALIRSGVGLSGVNLELGMGYRPRGSAPRDLLDFSRLIDHWSQLGVPLHVTLAFPSATGDDPLARSDLEVECSYSNHMWDENVQAEWVDRFLPLLMAKQSVVGIFWSHFSDQAVHHFPHAGLLRCDGSAKPVLEHILNYRREFWSPQNGG